MEIMKICLSLLLEQDLDMYSAELDIRAHARTTNLSEELGQIGYIFSDKTGTLTSNVMVFRKCSIVGNIYTDDSADDLTTENDITVKRPFECAALRQVCILAELQCELTGTQALAEDPHGHEAHFIKIIAACQTVIPEVGPDDGEIVYQVLASSHRIP